MEEVADPVLASNHVLIRPHYSLISSGTETASIHPDVLKTVAENPSVLRQVLEVAKKEGPWKTLLEVQAKFKAYAVLGYSGAGVVVDKHKTVTDLSIGDRVAYGGEGTGHAETILAGRNLVARMPEGLPFDQATFATLGAIAVNSVRNAGIGLGDVVAVVGLGLVGQLVTQLVRQQGGVAIGIDLKADRVELAKSLGADYGIAGSTVKEQVLSLTNGRGADCVIIAAAAKSDGPAKLSLDICRDRGRIVVVGAIEMNFPWLQMYLKEIQLFMARAYGPGSYDPQYEMKGIDYPISYIRWTENRNMEDFLRLVALGRVRVKPLITHSYGLEQAPQAYETIMQGASSLAVVLRYPEADLDSPSRVADVIRRRVDTPPESIGPSGKVNVAIVGAGGIARWAHLPVIGKISDVEVRAMFSTSGARGKTYAMRYRAAYSASDYNEILNDPQVHMVLIVSRNQHHARHAIEALRAGKHVFVEKPMALTVEECRDLEQAVAETGRQLTVGFNRRFAPFYMAQKQQLAGRSGPAVVSCRVNSPGISGSYWMADPSIGGAILGEACHFIDLMYWLLESEPVCVSAYSLPTGKQDPVGENNLVASFRFADGSIGNLTYCTIGSKTSGGERVEVFAQGIGVKTEDFKKLAIQGSMARNKSSYFGDKGYDSQMRAFVDVIMKSKTNKITVRDGSRSTIGCLAMLESAATGHTVSIDIDASLRA